MACLGGAAGAPAKAPAGFGSRGVSRSWESKVPFSCPVQGEKEGEKKEPRIFLIKLLEPIRLKNR